MDDPLLERLRRALAPDFEVDCRLAAGGMGIVYRAREVALDRLVAIKVLRPELATASARERFLRESRLLARLQHPHIVPVHRADERDGLPFYVMDLIEGRTLADRLKAGPLAPRELVRFSLDLADALGAAHAAGIIHRDVKPHNIFLVGSRLLLGDFGIARDSAAADREVTEAGLLIGTRQYMAPEQLKSEVATERSDQYASAAVLFEAASGREWNSLTDPARADWRGVPDALRPVLQRALSTDPEARWASMDAMQLALRRARHRRRRQWTVVGVATGAALVTWGAWSALVPPAPPANHRALAILPFTAASAGDDSLGMHAAENASINWYSFPSIPQAVFPRGRTWRAEHPAEDESAARWSLDVDRVVSGRLERRGDAVRLELALTDSTGTRQLRPIVLEAHEATAEALGDSAARLIAITLRRPGTDLRNLASRSSDAVLAFMQGEQYFDEDAWGAAAEQYGKAIAADSTFVLARWRLLVAQIWSRDFSWDSATTLAACCADQLPNLEAGLVRAMGDTNLVTRFAAFDRLQLQYGGDGSLPLLFASDLFHRGPLMGRSLTRSLAMFQQAIEYSPGGTPAPAYDHMVWGSTRLGNRGDARAWLRARKRLTTDVAGQHIVLFLQLGYDLRWVYWRAKLKLWFLERFESAATIEELANFYRFSATWDLPQGQDAVGAVIASRLLAKDKASGLEAQGLAHLTWGRVTEGIAFIDSAARYFDSGEAELQRRQWRLLLPLLGAGRVSESDEAAARRWLDAQANDQRYAARARWTLALDALHRGDTAGTLGWLAALDQMRETDSNSAALAVLARAIHDGERDPRGALAATAPLLRFDSPRPGHDIFTRSLLHLSRAGWFEAAGDPEGARREILWYENSDTYAFPTREAQKMEVDAVASVAARVTRARLLLDAGEADAACSMLRRVRQLWKHADASLASARARADTLDRARCR